MKKIDYVLDFCKELGKSMIVSGANLERVDLSLEKICHAYGLHDVTMSNLSTRISLSAKDEDKNYAHRQTDVPQMSINLERLKKLNNLSYEVTKNTPDPSTLYSLLYGVENKPYPWWIKIIGFMIAVAGISRLCNAGLMEILCVEVNTLIMFGLSNLFAKIKLNKIISNFICMFLSAAVAMMAFYLGIINSFYVVCITNALWLIPGIPMVNCARNIFCGNEENGLIQLLKVLLEMSTIVAGFGAAHGVFAPLLTASKLETDLCMIEYEMTFIKSLEFVILSIMASTGLGITFNIKPKDLVFAGIGGALIRIAFILFELAVPQYRFIFTLLAAFVAALYSEILANIKKYPTTLFLYPSILPIIPGSYLYYFGLGLIWQNPTYIEYGADLLFALLGISVGFVVCSSIVHYFRKIKFARIKKS